MLHAPQIRLTTSGATGIEVSHLRFCPPHPKESGGIIISTLVDKAAVLLVSLSMPLAKPMLSVEVVWDSRKGDVVYLFWSGALLASVMYAMYSQKARND